MLLMLLSLHLQKINSLLWSLIQEVLCMMDKSIKSFPCLEWKLYPNLHIHSGTTLHIDRTWSSDRSPYWSYTHRTLFIRLSYLYFWVHQLSFTILIIFSILAVSELRPFAFGTYRKRSLTRSSLWVSLLAITLFLLLWNDSWFLFCDWHFLWCYLLMS